MLQEALASHGAAHIACGIMCNGKTYKAALPLLLPMQASLSGSEVWLDSSLEGRLLGGLASITPGTARSGLFYPNC